MRTTISIDDELLAEAKALAARSGRTLAAVVEDALREVFARRRQTQRERGPVDIPTFDFGGVRPGVNLDSNAALLALMEEADRPDPA